MISKSEKETCDIAKILSKKIENGGLICLFGDLGTGKTTLTKAIAEHLGIQRDLIKSPTYNYIRKYELKERDFFHLDLYRLEEMNEIIEMEIEEILNGDNAVVIEWADRIIKDLPETRIDVTLSYIDSNTRKIEIDDKI